MTRSRLLLPLLPALALAVLAGGLSMLSSALPAAAEDATPATPNRAKLEKKFRETLNGATMLGRWREVKEGSLGEEKEERYTIRGVTKGTGDIWILLAQVQFGKKDVTLPVPVNVHWAGDTPVISITNAGLPGLGTYTARVLIYDNLYTGTWSGPGHGGFLSGTILRENAEEGLREDAKKSGPTSASTEKKES